MISVFFLLYSHYDTFLSEQRICRLPIPHDSKLFETPVEIQLSIYIAAMASTDKDQNGSFGYDFEDKQTRLQLELMDQLQRLGISKYIDLPQVTFSPVLLPQGADKLKLVVVGDQSTGKSSVLQAVTEIPFLIDDKMCTRFATEVVLKRTLPDYPTSIKISIIPAPDDTPERKKILGAWQPEGFDESGTLNKEAMKSVFKQVQRFSLLGELG